MGQRWVRQRHQSAGIEDQRASADALLSSPQLRLRAALAPEVRDCHDHLVLGSGEREEDIWPAHLCPPTEWVISAGQKAWLESRWDYQPDQH
jgi:hypothetical protein